MEYRVSIAFYVQGDSPRQAALNAERAISEGGWIWNVENQETGKEHRVDTADQDDDGTELPARWHG